MFFHNIKQYCSYVYLMIKCKGQRLIHNNLVSNVRLISRIKMSKMETACKVKFRFI